MPLLCVTYMCIIYCLSYVERDVDECKLWRSDPAFSCPRFNEVSQPYPFYIRAVLLAVLFLSSFPYKDKLSQKCPFCPYEDWFLSFSTDLKNVGKKLWANVGQFCPKMQLPWTSLLHVFMWHWTLDKTLNFFCLHNNITSTVQPKMFYQG